MSEQIIGTATVVVEADTRQFRAQLTAALADATKKPVVVTVTPTNTGFIKELNRQIKELQNVKPVQIPIESNAAGFVTKLNADLKALDNLKPVKVLVEPDFAGFRSKLQAGVKEFSAGIVANVAVVPSGTAKGTGAAAGAATRAAATTARQKTAEQALNEALNAGVASRRKLDSSLSIEEKRLARLARQKVALKASEEALTIAVRRGTAAQQEAAEAEVARNRAAVARTEGVIERAAAAPQERARAAEQLAADEAKAEKQRRTARAQTAQEFEKIEKARLASDKRAASQRIALFEEVEKAERDASAAAVKAGEDEARANLNRVRQQEAAAKAGEKIRRDEIGRLQAEALERNRAVLRLEDKIGNVRQKAANVDRAGVTAKSALSAAEREQSAATRAATAANKLFEKSIDTATAAQRRELGALLATTAALEQQKTAALAQARIDDAKAKSQSSVVRAVAAQTLQLIGLRGAALSADLAFLGAAASVIVFAGSLKTAAQFASTLNVFGVTAEATAAEMEKARAVAVELGRDITLPGVGAQDAAEALTELSKAGLSVQDSIDGARGVLQLATAASIDNAQATELAASALNAFGLAGADATHVADVLANAANASQGSIVDIGTALQQSAAVARQAGLSLEQTVAALTIFARAGLRGSDAGTSFRTMLIRLINPTKKAQAEIDKLGLHIRDAQGNININVLAEFAAKTRDLTAAQRDQTLAIIFGQDAIRGAAILARTGSLAFNEQITQLNKQGTAARVAAARMTGLTGAVEQLRNTVSSAGIAIGESLTPAMVGLTTVITTTIGTVQSLLEEMGRIREDASKPIEYLIDIIPEIGGDGKLIGRGKAGEGGGIEDRAKKFVDGFVSTLPGQIKAASESFTDLRDTIREGLADFEAIKANRALPAFFEDLNEAIASGNRGEQLLVFNEVVLKLKEMEKNMAGGSKESARFRENFSNLIKQLQDLSVQPDIVLPLTLPPDLFEGTVGGEAGAKTAGKFNQAFLPSFQETLEAASARFRQAFQDAAELAARDSAAAFDKALTQASNQSKGFDREVTRAQIAGDVNAEISALEGKAERQRRIIARINRETGGDPKDKNLATITEAEQTLVQTLERIRQLEEQQTSKIEQKGKEVKEARDKADQAFLDALSRGRQPIDRRLARAQSTEDPGDDITALVAMRKRIQAEIRAVQSGVKDAKTKTEELQRLADELFQNSLDLQEARDRRDEAIKQSIADRRAAQRQFAELTNDTPFLIRLLNQEIADARAAVVAARAAQQGVEAAKLAVQTLVEKRRQMVNDARNSLLQDAFRLAELQGNKSAMLRILDLQIAQARLEVKQARTLAERLQEQIELQELINKRNELLGESAKEGEKSGTTAFDLLAQAVETFNNNAGNLINPNQPFAGPTGFTTDLSQFLIRRNRGAGGGAGAGVGSARLKDPDAGLFGQPRKSPEQQESDNLTRQLIAALEALTNATLGVAGGNNSTAGLSDKAVTALGKRGQAMAKYYDSTQSRKVREGRSGI